MMASEPSAETIQQFQDIAPVERDLALKFIRGAGNNLEGAINNYFENPDRYNNDFQGFDESAFAANRYGDSAEQGPPAFQIHSYDETAYGTFPSSTAPTRPPSRNSDSSMRAQVDIQESGVLPGGQFGPAQREHYDSSQWAMTTRAAEVYPDLDAWDLSKDPEEPTFMKPIPSGDSLPAFFTCFAHIPLVQHLLLSDKPMVDDYAQGSDWWKGVPLDVPYTEEDVAEVTDRSKLDLFIEVQRLVAFTMGSERLYGSVEPLQNLEFMRNINPLNSAFFNNETERFMTALTAATEGDDDLPKLFTSVFSQNGKESPFFLLTIHLDAPTGDGPRTLYDVVDNLVWDLDQDPEEEVEGGNFLKELAPILVLKINNPDASSWTLNTQIPETWYLDRYVEENYEATKEMRKTIVASRREISRIDDQIRALQTHRVEQQNTTVFKSEDLINSSLDYLNRSFEEPSVDDAEDGVDPNEPSAADLAARLSAIHTSLKDKLLALDADKVALRAKLAELSNSFKGPSADNPRASQPQYRYRLCGVTTNPKNVFVPKRDLEGSEQWWKMEYEAAAPAFARQRIDEPEVLHHAATDSRDALLIYALDSATAPRPITLPPPISRFVENDNAALHADRSLPEATVVDAYPRDPWQDIDQMERDDDDAATAAKVDSDDDVLRSGSAMALDSEADSAWGAGVHQQRTSTFDLNHNQHAQQQQSSQNERAGGEVDDPPPYAGTGAWTGGPGERTGGAWGREKERTPRID